MNNFSKNHILRKTDLTFCQANKELRNFICYLECKNPYINFTFKMCRNEANC